MQIDQIQIGFRYRKDLGDLRSLADSISEVGLLHCRHDRLDRITDLTTEFVIAVELIPGWK